MGTSTASARVSAFASAYAPLLVCICLVPRNSGVGFMVSALASG